MATAFITNTILDLNMLRYLGVSVKETENPIGFFGTGLKYAIAVFLRLNHQVEMVIDGKRYKFSKMTKTFRGEEHATVIMESYDNLGGNIVEHLPITLNYGRSWSAWMAYRELVTNTMDEKGQIIDDFDDNGFDYSGKTVFVVIGDDISQCRRDHDLYFLRKNPVGSLNDSIVAHRNAASQGIFYRGVCVHTFPPDRPARFAYEVNYELLLTEDRTLKNVHSVLQNISIAVSTITFDKELIRQMVSMKPIETQEAYLDYNWSNPTEEFIEVVGDMIKADESSVVPSAKTCWEEYTSKSSIQTAEFTNVQRLALTRALDFLERSGYPQIRTAYPIKRMINNPRARMGQAKDDVIYLTDTAFSYGVKTVMATLLEEYIHLHHYVDDLSREMQDILFTKIIDLFEEHIIKEPI